MAHVLRRLLLMPFLLLVLGLCTFVLLRLTAAGPTEAGTAAIPGLQASIASGPSADAPFVDSFLRYVSGLLDGSLTSIRRPGVTVGEVIGRTAPVSAVLGCLSLLLALGVGIPTGVMAAVRHGSPADRLVMILAAVGISVPGFVLAPVLVLAFSFHLGWLPPARWDGAATMVLPSITLGAAHAAYLARLARAGTLEVLELDYVRTARAKGLPAWRIVFRHVLPGAMLPVLSYLGPTVASLVTGTAIIEKIFQIPGMGLAFVQAALNRDYTLVLGLVTFYGAVLMVLNLLVDVASAWLDPRVRVP